MIVLSVLIRYLGHSRGASCIHALATRVAEGAREALQHAAARQHDRMRYGVLHVERGVLVFAMVVQSADRVNASMQRSAECQYFSPTTCDG
jgi:hypothetical protein